MKRVMRQGLLLVLITVAVGGFVGIQQASYIEGRKEKISLVNISLAAQIEEKINREIYITKILEILIRANENEPFSAFNHTASELLRISPERSAYQADYRSTAEWHCVPGRSEAVPKRYD